jgi:hypothetical protein
VGGVASGARGRRTRAGGGAQFKPPARERHFRALLPPPLPSPASAPPPQTFPTPPPLPSPPPSPQLSKFPAKYIYEPWTAPLEVQRSCGCVVGRDYPFPVVDHTAASKRNMERMKKAYAANK